MKQFYHDLAIEKSWQILKDLKKEIDFILIGGWAVYLYTKKLKSKDIDIIINFSSLEDLRKKFNVYKNVRLAKYEVKKEAIDIDIYIPYFSNIGLSVEKVVEYQNMLEGFKTLQIEMLAITKQAAYAARKSSLKGKKDAIDIISLVLNDEFDFKLYRKLIKKFRLEKFKSDLTDLLENTIEINELGLNRHFFAKKKREIFRKLDRLSQDDF